MKVSLSRPLLVGAMMLLVLTFSFYFAFLDIPNALAKVPAIPPPPPQFTLPLEHEASDLMQRYFNALRKQDKTTLKTLATENYFSDFGFQWPTGLRQPTWQGPLKVTHVRFTTVKDQVILQCNLASEQMLKLSLDNSWFVLQKKGVKWRIDSVQFHFDLFDGP